jgi:uncharacterized protein with HEPN domain
MKPGAQSDQVYVMHVLECIERVQIYCADGEASFRASRLIQDAVIRNLQVMPESSQRLSTGARALNPDVPWRALSGFRNIVVHDYLGIDADVIWRVVADELPMLRQGLKKVAESLADQRR